LDISFFVSRSENYTYVYIGKEGKGQIGSSMEDAGNGMGYKLPGHLYGIRNGSHPAKKKLRGSYDRT